MYLLLYFYYRRYDEWQRRLRVEGHPPCPFPVRNRPTLSDGPKWVSQYESALHPCLCVLLYYGRREYVSEREKRERHHRFRGGDMQLVVHSHACVVDSEGSPRHGGGFLVPAPRCRFCPIRIHRRCSLLKMATVCNWCVSKMGYAFGEDPRVGSVSGACSQLSMHDSVPMDLSACGRALLSGNVHREIVCGWNGCHTVLFRGPTKDFEVPRMCGGFDSRHFVHSDLRIDKELECKEFAFTRRAVGPLMYSIAGGFFCRRVLCYVCRGLVGLQVVKFDNSRVLGLLAVDRLRCIGGVMFVPDLVHEISFISSLIGDC